MAKAYRAYLLLLDRSEFPECGGSEFPELTRIGQAFAMKNGARRFRKALDEPALPE